MLFKKLTLQRHTFQLYFAALAAMACLGCVPANNTSPSNTQVNTSGNTVSANQNLQPEPEIANVPFTMPIIDAILHDEEFVSQARTQLQLTDEEVDRIRSKARDYVLQLSNDPSLDDERSTLAATDEAKNALRDILGQERGDRFVSLVQRQWSGREGELTVKPSSVPKDTRVVINVPAYRMDLFTDGEIVRSYKVGIGYPEFPLPIGLRKADTIIFNPTWTPPDSPWVKGKVRPGETVQPGSELNPLGPIKIPIGMPALIHGGKVASRLGTFASHGCVGLTDNLVQDFAARLSEAAGKPISMQEVKAYEEKNKDTENVKLGREIPVELRYETIMVVDGTLMIYRDVYERGTNTEENLRSTLSEFGVDLDSLDEKTKKQMLDAVKEMAVDAKGKPVEPSSLNRNSNTSPSGSNNNSGSTTKSIKGRKEVSIKLPQLVGKGYPAPVKINN